MTNPMCFSGTCNNCGIHAGLAYSSGRHLCLTCSERETADYVPTQAEIAEFRRLIDKIKLESKNP